jgi:hypothetical protein
MNPDGSRRPGRSPVAVTRSSLLGLSSHLAAAAKAARLTSGSSCTSSLRSRGRRAAHVSAQPLVVYLNALPDLFSAPPILRPSSSYDTPSSAADAVARAKQTLTFEAGQMGPTGEGPSIVHPTPPFLVAAALTKDDIFPSASQIAFGISSTARARCRPASSPTSSSHARPQRSHSLLRPRATCPNALPRAT